jgi:hypothetical protein
MMGFWIRPVRVCVCVCMCVSVCLSVCLRKQIPIVALSTAHDGWVQVGGTGGQKEEEEGRKEGKRAGLDEMAHTIRGRRRQGNPAATRA